MANVVYASLKPRKAHPHVTRKRVRGPGGGRTTIYSVDPASPTFSEDLRYVFHQNVIKARKANKRRLALRDRATAKH
jgi:hypothetical protein